MRLRRTELIAGASGVAVALVLTAGQPDASILIGAALATAARWPRATWIFVAVVLVAVAAVTSTLPGDGGFATYTLLAAHGFAVGRFERGRWAVAGAAALTLAAVLASSLAHVFEWVYLFASPAAWGAGRALRDRALLAERLRAREHELERERDAYAALSVRHERARIAAELHDVVAHAISVMVIQASAGQRLARRDAQGTAEAFEAIADAARRAEGDMARLVTLLDADPSGETPDLALVDELVTRARRTGLDVNLRLDGDLADLDPAVVQAVCGVVREGLTNALRYAAGASVTAAVRGERDDVVVELANGTPAAAAEGPLRGTGTGNGLRGLRERIGSRGGTVLAGPADGGGWTLSARIPRWGTAAVSAPRELS
jgi:signal transduction histidine kinase